jgi:hypothetical protein
MTAPSLRPRRDGWTPDRQATFVAACTAGASIAAAAAAAGMSRRAAYRLRAHPAGAAVAAAVWPQPLAPAAFDDLLDARLDAAAARRAQAPAAAPPDTRRLIRLIEKLAARA